MSATIRHTLPPVFDSSSRILLLGTMPSPKSRETGFYYGHPQNRFWCVLAAVFAEDVPQTIAEKTALLHRHRLALWDVLASCSIDGAADSSIRNPVSNDFSQIVSTAPICRVYTTGQKAFVLYNRYCFPQTHIPAVCLPSTSPANCAYWTFEKLVQAYCVLAE